MVCVVVCLVLLIACVCWVLLLGANLGVWLADLLGGYCDVGVIQVCPCFGLLGLLVLVVWWVWCF